jgi:hypothetical protein
MNISYEDGSHSVRPYDAEELAKEAKRPDFVSAKVYQPGKIVHMSDRDYRVGPAGNLIRITKK